MGHAPPQGDFASYVETLSRQAAVQRRAEEAAHGLDAGMTSAAPHSSQAGTAGANEAAGTRSHPALPAMAGLGWAILMLAALAGGVAWTTVALLLGVGLWGAYQMRRWLWPRGAASWRQWLEAAASKQQDRKRQKP
ncbi:MAG: hypothetical protein NVSMB34_01110 [Variovorax sp.]